MIKKRIIPVLLYQNGRMVKGINFENYRDTGDPVYTSKVYNAQYVDELIFIDIEASVNNNPTNFEIIEKISNVCFMPLTIGGGISNIEHINNLLSVGADKVIINTKAIESPQFIEKASNQFGSQCIVIGIDVKKINGIYTVYKKCGQIKTDINLCDYIKKIEKAGAGEIFINSIDSDGIMSGYDIDLIKLVCRTTKLPVIACGGAGKIIHVADTFLNTEVSALAMSSLYHFGDNNPIRVRSFLKNRNIPIKTV